VRLLHLVRDGRDDAHLHVPLRVTADERRVEQLGIGREVGRHEVYFVGLARDAGHARVLLHRFRDELYLLKAVGGTSLHPTDDEDREFDSVDHHFSHRKNQVDVQSLSLRIILQDHSSHWLIWSLLSEELIVSSAECYMRFSNSTNRQLCKLGHLVIIVLECSEVPNANFKCI